MKKLLLSFIAVLMSTFTYADGWEKATEIAAGDVVVLAVDNGSVTKELSEITTIGVAADYSGTPAGTYPLTVVAGSTEGSFAFQNADGAYLAWTSGNSLTTSETLDAASSWTVTYTNEKWDIYNVGTTARKLQYNANSPRFACYGNSGQTAVDLWKKVADGSVAKPTLPASTSFTGRYAIEITAEEGAAIYYTTDGTDPTTESTLYESVLTISETTTVKAIAVVDGKASSVAEATYTVIALGTIADAAAAEKGTTCYVQGTVIATAAQGMLVQDETGIIYYYNTAGVPAKQGDVVTILGKIGQYGGKNQFTSDAQVVVVGSAALAHPAAAAMDGAALETWAASEDQAITWATLTGTLAISGNYYNVTVDGAENYTLALVKPLQAVTAGTVTVSGYLAYVNKKYAYMLAVDIQQAVTDGAEVSANNQTYKIVSTNKFLNGSFDNGVTDWYATNYETAAVPTNFTWNAEGGFDGGAYITYNAGGVGSVAAPRISAAVEAGKTYLFQAYTKGTVTDGNKQYNALKYAGDSNGEGTTIGQLNWGDADSWTVTNIVFTPEEDGIVRFRSSWTSNTSLDGVALYEVEAAGVSTAELEAAITAAQATIDNKEGVGTGVFQIAESALAVYQEAVDAANTLVTKQGITLEEVEAGVKALEDAKAVYLSTVNTPAEGVTYSIQQKASGLYLGFTETGVVLAEQPTALSWEAAEGGWYITDGTYYVGLAGTNNWTMSSAADKKFAITPSVTEIEGVVYYTLNEVKGLIATDATEAGSPCYADKSLAQGDKAYWSFAEYIEPVVPEETVSVFFANASDDPCGTLSTRSEDKTTLTTLDASGLAGVTLTAAAFDQATWFKVRCLSIKPSAAKTAEKVTITAPEGYVIDSYVINAFSVSKAYAPYLIDFNEEYTGQDVPAAMTEFPEVKVNASSASFWIYCNAETVANWLGVSKFMVNLKKAGEATTYAINIAEGIENGTVVADKETAAAEETVTLTVTPAEGYVLDALSVISSEGNVIEVAENTFTMPAADVQVSATFKEAGAGFELTDGKYYFKNVGAGLFWGAGNSWGTQASLLKNPDFLTLVSNEDGTYKLESQVSNGGTNYYFTGTYMDGAAISLTITELDNGYFTIANGEKFYGSDGSNIIAALTSGDDANAQWQIIPEADMLASLAEASIDAPVDATFLIIDHTFGRNHRNVAAWTNEGGAAITGGNSNKHCAEKYHGVYNVYQKLANAPAGVYKFTAQGFYRQDGTDEENMPVVYANDVTAQLPLKTGTENSMADACASFEAGNYTIDPIYVEVTTAGELTVGSKLETNTTLWCIWDNFELYYYGSEATVDEVRYAGLIKELAALKEEATALKADAGVSTPTAEALGTAIEGATIETPSEEAYAAAIAALKAAMAQAKKDITNKAAIDAMYELIKSTNVYTAEALATYQGKADAYKASYEAGTLTETVDNPSIIHSWRAANDFDDLLLSAWSIDEVQASEYTTAFYVNTWSNEGENDGSNFKVPFFEYWIADANSLAQKNISATLSDIEAGYYDITAWVRVRAKNGVAAADATGITMTVNAGDAIDITDGTVLEGTQFALAQVKARGVVGEDGVMKINIDVAADFNISWLSMKNFMYTKVDESEVYYENALAKIKDGNFYQVTTTVGETTYYLTGEGKLTDDVDAATSFEFKAVEGTTFFKPVGWNLGYHFTNPNLTNGSTGDVKNEGYIRPDANNDRDDWERQVFFFDGEKYAVRATNSAGTTWGANTYWDVLEGAEVPTAGYSLEMQYKWNLVDVTADFALAALQSEIAATAAIVEARTGVGTALFQKSEEDLAALAAAVEAAQAVADNEGANAETIQAARTALAEANTVYANAGNAPVAGTQYMIQQKASGMYLALNESGVIIAAEPYALTWEAAETGGWYLTDGTYYVGLLGTNNWTMSSAADKKLAINPSLTEIEGVVYYTLNEAKGIIGTDATDAGASCWADKSVAKSGDKAYWSIAEYVDPSTTLEQTIDVARYTGLGYGVTVAQADIAAAKEFLGVEELTTDMLSIINSDGTVVTDYATFDGWFNAEGVATTWGDNTAICVKFFQALPEGKFEICDMNGADVLDKTYTVKWALSANDKQVIYTINVTFTAAPVFKPEIIQTIDVAATAAAGTAYEGATATFDPDAVATALGLTSIADADQYIVNVTDGSFVLNSTDGWRSAAGDAATWGTGEGMVCVKISDPATGSIDYIGAIDNTYKDGDTFTAKWGFVNDENKAVVINVNITFTTPDGISTLSSLKNATIYDLSGRKITKIQRGGIYIVNGKRVTIK